MKKPRNKFVIFTRNLWKLIDNKIVLPITNLVVNISDYYERSGKKLEILLSKSTTLLFLSLFLAIGIFIFVDQKVLSFSENSAEVLKEQKVNVVYNEEAYVVEGLPKTVDVTLIGRKADLYFASQSPSHEITVDLSGLKPGTHTVNIKYNQALASIEYEVNPSVATVIIYPKISETKTLTTDILNLDSLDEKLVIEKVNIDNDKVVVKGAEHRLAEVATVKALVDIKKLTTQEEGTITLKDIPLKAFDTNGNVVDVEIVPAKINADIEISSPSKELPIRVIPKGELSFGQAISNITMSETRVRVYGSNDVLSELTYIPLEIDVNGLKDDRKYKVELPKPVGIKSMDVNNLTVNISLGKSTSRVVNDIKIKTRNLADGYSVQGISEDDIKVSVTLKGVDSVINNINAEDITAYINLKGYGEGTHEVPVEVVGTDPKVVYTPKTKKVRIKIVK